LADRPTYVGDATLFADTSREIHFSRDFNMLDDTSLLLMDSGCENPWGGYGNVTKCPYASRVFRTAPFQEEVPGTTLSGYYLPDLSHVNIYAVPDEEVRIEYQCGFETLFQAEWIPGEKLGKNLLTAAQQTRRSCPRATE
jgi:hypothetical protein